jgi:hypothetical protein
MAELALTPRTRAPSWVWRLAGVRPTRNRILVIAGLAAAALAGQGASMVRPPIEDDLGLVRLLPATYWIGLVALNVLFVIALNLRSDRERPPSPMVMLVLVAALVSSLYGVAAFSTDYPRGEVPWRHVGIADSLIRTGSIDPTVDAYFNWPGFFAPLALTAQATGINPLTLAVWAPMVNIGLWLAALAIVTRSLTTDRRRLWVTLWVFALGNWQDQDYLSPQAFGLFLYLAILALLLKDLGATTDLRPFSHGRSAASVRAWWLSRVPLTHDRRRRVAALVTCLVLVAVIAASHQLTPFMLIVAVGVLAISGRIWSPGLLLLAVIIVSLWLAFPASSYLAGHPPLAQSGIGVATSANVADRVSGTPGHLFVVQVRMGLAVALWLLAGIGFLLDRRAGHRDLRPAMLLAAPFIVYPVQSYGGEMLIRVSLFALPFTAYLAAGALLPREVGRRRWVPWPPRADEPLRLARLTVVFSVIGVLMITGRYGNARFDIFTENEIVATQELYRLAPPGAAIISAAHPTPWRNQSYLEHRYRTMNDLCERVPDATACATAVHAYARHGTDGAMLLLNRASRNAMIMQGIMTPDSYRAFEEKITSMKGTHLLYANPDAAIYRIDPP